MSSGDDQSQSPDFADLLGYETAFSSLPDPVFIYNHSSRKILKSNEAAVRRYGYSHDEFRDVVPWDIEAPFDKDKMLILIDGLKERCSAVYKAEHRTADGALFPVEMHTVYRCIDGADIFIATCRELTERVESEARVEVAEGHYRAIFETSVSLISVIDLNAAMFLDVNPAFEDLLGFTRDELLSTSFVEFIHPDDLERTQRVVEQELLAGRESIRFQNRYRKKNGGYVWLEWSSRPFASEGLLDKGIIYAVAHNVSRQKEVEERLREQNQRMRLHVEQTILAVIEWDVDFRVQQWNTAAETIFGYKRGEVLGRHGKFILPNEFRAGANIIWEKLLRASGGNRSVNENVRKDGAMLMCEWVNTTLVDAEGRVVGVASLVFDVTESEARKKELEEAKESAEKANQAKSEFLSVMSHELRTPLNSIVGPCQLLQAEVKDASSARMLEVMLASSTHLLELINRILDLSKIESGTMDLDLTPVHLKDFLDKQLLPLRTSANGKGLEFSVEFEFEHDVVLLTDGRLLTQALLNLVGNSIKFTNEGYVKVRVSEEDDDCRIEIKDTGVGVSPKLMGHLFEPFRQEEMSMGRDQEGTGLGLSITKSIVEKLDGRIEVQSVKGHGSSFTVFLPNKICKDDNVESLESKEESTDLKAGASFKVLLVEDEPNNQFVGTAMLKFLNYKFDLAKSGEEAVEMFKKNEYGVVLMDIRMPGMGGVEAGKRIREISGERPISIIAQSAYALKEQKESFLSQGMDDYISKPIELDTLKASLEAAEKRYRVK